MILNVESRSGQILAGFVMLLVVGAVDFLLGYRVGFSIFYLVPILLVSWKIGRIPGFAFAFAAAHVWFLVDMLSRDEHASPMISYWNCMVRLGFFLIIVGILTAMKQERVHARIDYLTGLSNRFALAAALEREIPRARRYRHPLTLVSIDCDNFKAVNDERGHQAGDRALCSIGEVIRRSVRSSDVAARVGGDEFAILLPQTGPEVARAEIGRLQDRLTERMREEGFPITFSIGAVWFQTAEVTVDEMLKQADDLMYAVKRGGKNGLRFEPRRPLDPSAPQATFGLANRIPARPAFPEHPSRTWS